MTVAPLYLPLIGDKRKAKIDTDFVRPALSMMTTLVSTPSLPLLPPLYTFHPPTLAHPENCLEPLDWLFQAD